MSKDIKDIPVNLDLAVAMDKAHDDLTDRLQAITAMRSQVTMDNDNLEEAINKLSKISDAINKAEGKLQEEIDHRNYLANRLADLMN